MKKGFLKTLTVAALTLAGVSPIYAFAPVISTIPDVVVGDQEDYVGTVDSNFFHYDNAINFLNYVSDQDTPTTAIRWSFVEADTTNTITINTKGQLAGAENPTSPPTGKELTSAGTDFFADFRITSLSPTPGSGPYTLTPAQTSGTVFFNRVITLFATDGSATDSQSIIVYAVENGFDRLSAAAAIYTEGFNTGLDGWTAVTLGSNLTLSNGTSVQPPTLAYDSGHGGAAGISSPSGANGTTTNYYGYYQSPAAIPYVSGKVYRARWAVTTNQATAANVPSMRLRLSQPSVVANSSIVSVNPGGSNLNVPTPSGDTTYSQYWQPVNLSSLQSSSATAGLTAYFELENFGGASVSGALYLDSLTVDLVDRPTQTADSTITTFNSSGTPSFTYLGGSVLNASWLNPTTSGINTSAFSIGITAGAATATDVGLFQGLGIGTVPAVAGNLYRATFTVKRGGSDAVGTFPAMRFRLNAGSGEVASENDTFNGGSGIASPSTTGTDYDVYLVGPVFSTATQPYVYPSFDLYSASTSESGTGTLTSIVTSHGAQP